MTILRPPSSALTAPQSNAMRSGISGGQVLWQEENRSFIILVKQQLIAVLQQEIKQFARLRQQHEVRHKR
jgi:hypothetical protein